jgi:hypothetical protein
MIILKRGFSKKHIFSKILDIYTSMHKKRDVTQKQNESIVRFQSFIVNFHLNRKLILGIVVADLILSTQTVSGLEEEFKKNKATLNISIL